jgi:hypothetical protein
LPAKALARRFDVDSPGVTPVTRTDSTQIRRGRTVSGSGREQRVVDAVRSGETSSGLSGRLIRSARRAEGRTGQDKRRVTMSRSFARLSGWSAIVAGIAALAYSVTFAVVVQNGDRWAQWASTLLLVTGALAAFPVLIGLYLQVRGADEGFSLLALAVGLVGATGTLLHGAFDLGVLANEPAQGFDYPSPTDPRGFATFLLAGATLALFSHLLGRVGAARGLVRLGYVTAVLLAWVWLGRLTALDPKEPWVAPAVIGSGFVGVPLWYVWVGRGCLLPAQRGRDEVQNRSEAVLFDGASSDIDSPARSEDPHARTGSTADR